MATPLRSTRADLRWFVAVILVTVGTQLGFDRLIKAVDEIALTLPNKVVAQIGRGDYVPKNMECERDLAPVEFDRLMASASLIVSHAGIGTVLTAQKMRKPIILVPRRADLGEHRNDHQIATAKQLTDRDGILVVYELQLLADSIEKGLKAQYPNPLIPEARRRLQMAVHSFIQQGTAVAAT